MKRLKKKHSRLLALLLTFVMMFSMVPTTAFAADRDTSKNQVRVIVENTKYSVDEGAAWDGTLVDTWVDIDESSSMMSCLVAALDEGGYVQEGAEFDYIQMINGLYAGAPDYMSGWMCMLNDWLINEGLGQFTVAAGKLEAGDEIKVAFSLDGGPDLGGTWANNDKTVKAVEFSTGTLSQTFDSAVKEYTLTVPSDTVSVEVIPTATNKNFQVRASVDGTEYKRTNKIPVEDGTVITVTCGDTDWPTMNAGDMGNGAENVPAEVYTFTVVKESANSAPSIIDGVKTTATITTDEKYSLDLSSVFTDAENDDLSYKVSVNEAEAVEASKDYIYEPAAAGTYTLAFTANDGKADSEVYTVTLMVEEAVKGTPVNVENNVIDIADNKFGVYSIFYATATQITVNGADVISAAQDGLNVYIVLDYATASDVTVTANFGFKTDLLTASQSGNTVTLENGTGSLTAVLTAKRGSSSKGSATYNLHFSCAKPPTEVPTRIVESDSKEVYRGVAFELNLKEYFENASGYYLVENGTLTELDDSKYTFMQTHGGTYTLSFAASNVVGTCPDYVTVIITAKEITSGIWVGNETSNGVFNYVAFTDVDGNEIEGLECMMNGTAITVTLPKSYDVSGKVKATFNLTQNASGLPFLSTSNSATGSGSATSKKITTLTSTLSSGSARANVYFYNSVPKATSNSYTTYTINYAIKNELPVLAEGQEASISANMTAGETYELDLNKLFADAEGDALNYKVSVNGAPDVSADAAYSYTTDIAGEYTLVFKANDGKGDSSDTFTVTLTVENATTTNQMTVNIPEDVTPSFYVANGFDENSMDIPGNALTVAAGEKENGLIPYIVEYPTNAQYISFRTDNWGGMAIPAEDKGIVTLRKAQISAFDFAEKKLEGASSVAFKDGDNTYIATGTGHNYLLVAGADYTYSFAPTDSGNYATGTKTELLESGNDVVEIVISIPYKSPKMLTVTTGATAQLFSYDRYYFMTEHAPLASVDNGDGTTTFYFSTTKSNLSWRTTMDGKITKAGYWPYSGNVTVDYTNENRTPDTRVDYSVSSAANAAVGDDSVLVNVNGQNHLKMSEGGTYKLKGYRVWEIIKTQTANEIIVPDFNFNILSGEDVISLTPVNSNSHSGSGDNSDWTTITALKEGTAIIEVTYDAIEVTGGSYDGLYGASDPARAGLIVVTVGKSDSSVDFGIEGFAASGSLVYSETNKKDWDAEFDTLYFLGEQGELKFSPSADGAINSVSVSNDKGVSWTTLTADEGTYTANIINGNNIIRVTTDNGVAYQVVRGKKLTTTIKEVDGSSDGDGLIEAGETVRVTFAGLHTPIPKMAGNYNPGYRANTDGDSSVHMVYSFNGENVNGASGQYSFAMTANYIDVTIPEDVSEDSLVLSDGYISLGVIGLKTFATGGDSHRTIPDAGCTTRGTETTFHTRSILPNVTIELGEVTGENSAPIVSGNAVEEAAITLGQNYAINPETLFMDKDGDKLTFKVSVDDDEAVDATTAYQFTPEAAGTYILTFIASDGKAEVSHSITLTVNEAQQPDDDEELVFDISGDEIKGYVTISFEDNGVRVEGEKGLKYPVPLGTIIEPTKVPYTTGDSTADVTVRLLDAMGIGYTNSGSVESGFYLSSIKNFVVNNTPYDEMGEFMAGQGSGWMVTLNDVFINQSASSFEVKNNDVIVWKYSCQLGVDIGDDYYQKQIDEVEKLISEIGTVTLESEESIKKAREAYDALDSDAQREAVENYDVLEAAEKALAELKAGEEKPDEPDEPEQPQDYDFEEIYKTTGDYMAGLGVPTVNSIGGDWMALGLARSGRTVSEKYYENVISYVEENINENSQLHWYKSTDNSRVILGLTATGHDASNVGGYNLLQGLSDMEYVGKQGVNGYFWALIALDSHDYEVPNALEGQEQVTREKLIDAILDAQLADHGWALAGNKADADMTGMAIQALAPYYHEDKDVKDAVDKALTRLSEMQLKDGKFGGSEGITAESCAQVVVALTALNINPDTDERFIKNGNSVLDALCSFYVEGGGFKHIADGKIDGMATEQGYYALTSYMRMLNGDTALYDMTDVTLEKDDTPVIDNDDLKDQVAANEVKALIDAIGNVTVHSEARIKEAREAYEKLTDDQKKLVDNYANLTAAEDALDKAQVDNTKSLIDSIGKVTINSKEAIKRARAAYDALTDAQKKQIDNYKTLTDAEEEFKVLEELGSKTSTKSLGKVDETDGPVVTKTAEEAKALMESINEDSLEGEILDAILAYDNLTKVEKEAIECEELYKNLQKQLQAMIQTDEKTGITLEDCEWNIRLVVDKIDDVEDFQDKVGEYHILGVWDVYLEDVLTGEKYDPKDAVKIKVPKALLEEMNSYDGVAIAHYTEEGKVEYLKCQVEGEYVVFHTLDFSYYAVIGYNGEGPAVMDVMESGTNYILWIALICGGILLAGIAVLAVMRRKVNK